MAAKKKAKPAKKTTAKPRVAKKAVAKKTANAKSAAKKVVKAKAPQIVHWEIQAKDAARIQRFYGDLFGWKIDANNPMKYGMVSSAGKDGINGGIGGSPGGRSRVLVYAEVSDINATLKKAESLGGKTILPRTDVGSVIMAIFEDVEGNQFGVIE